MNDFSGPDMKRGHRGSHCCFQMLKRLITYPLLSFIAQEELPHAGSTWEDTALPLSVSRQEHKLLPRKADFLHPRYLIYEYSTRFVEWCDHKLPLSHREKNIPRFLQLFRAMSVLCFLFSHFLPSSSLSCAHGQTDNFHCSPIHSQGATYICHLWTTNMKIPPNPRWGSKMRRGNSICFWMHACAWNWACFPVQSFFFVDFWLSNCTLENYTGEMERRKQWGPLFCVLLTSWTTQCTDTLQPGSGRGHGIGASIQPSMAARNGQ